MTTTAATIMQTRSGSCYGKRRHHEPRQSPSCRAKRQRTPAATAAGQDAFDPLPDDLVLAIFSKVAASSSSPATLASVVLTCKRFNELSRQPMVLAAASAGALAVRAAGWCEPAHEFLKRCAEAGNLEACYILGMIRFYCLGSRPNGTALMARAAMGGNAAALYSLSVIQFNGSGGGKGDKDLRAGVALCARAASLGHIDALRELGHCLQDGYGVRRNVGEGRRFLIQANGRELVAAMAAHRHVRVVSLNGCCPLLSDFGWIVPEAEPHPANRFLSEWWSTHSAAAAGDDELRLCSHVRCGRRETRRHEFRRCSVCGRVNYCSRACQAMDWKRCHKAECAPMDRWVMAVGAVAAAATGHVGAQ